jgi:hypothetical protein
VDARDRYQQYLKSFTHEEERVASKARFGEALHAARELLELLEGACIEHDVFRDAATTLIESYTLQLRALERACRRSASTEMERNAGLERRDARR